MSIPPIFKPRVDLYTDCDRKFDTKVAAISFNNNNNNMYAYITAEAAAGADTVLDDGLVCRLYNIIFS